MQATAHQSWRDTLQGLPTMPNQAAAPEGSLHKHHIMGGSSGTPFSSNIMPSYDDGALIMANNSFRPPSQLRHHFEHGDLSPSNHLAWSPDSAQSDDTATVSTPVDPYSIPPPLVDMYTNEVCLPSRVPSEVDWQANAHIKRADSFAYSAQFPHSLNVSKGAQLSMSQE